MIGAALKVRRATRVRLLYIEKLGDWFHLTHREQASLLDRRARSMGGLTFGLDNCFEGREEPSIPRAVYKRLGVLYAKRLFILFMGAGIKIDSDLAFPGPHVLIRRSGARSAACLSLMRARRAVGQEGSHAQLSRPVNHSEMGA